MSGPPISLERVGTSVAGVTDSYELCVLESNSRSFQEQQVLLSTKPSPQLLFYLKSCIRVFVCICHVCGCLLSQMHWVLRSWIYGWL